ncbi:hypothetical protein GYB22_04530 [bacterium]|nr:hypothetical protein [bacterium]
MNTEQSIEIIYDWLEQLSFDELSQDQQKIVLKEIDRQTYTEMHEAMNTLSSTQSPNSFKRKEASKSAVMVNFNSRSNKSPMILLLKKPIALGKAAAVILLLCSALLWLGLSKTTAPMVESSPLSSDTVYITQNKVVMQNIYDTVYDKSVVYVQTRPAGKPGASSPSPTNNLQEIDLHVVRTDDRNSTLNSSKKNNFKHDTLVKKIGFVTM